MVLLTNGTVASWGSNQSGEVGDGSTVQERITPVLVKSIDGSGPLTGAIDVEASDYHGIARMSDGRVLGWGNYQALCTGANAAVYRLPVALPLGTNVTKVAIGVLSGLYLRGDGSLVSCGDNLGGLDGRPTTVLTANTPGVVTGMDSGVVDMDTGVNHDIALKSDGTVWAWGSNFNNQLGLSGANATTDPIRTPAQVAIPPGPKVVAVAAGRDYSMAVRADGTVLAWGFNQLGGGLHGPALRTVDQRQPRRSRRPGGHHR